MDKTFLHRKCQNCNHYISAKSRHHTAMCGRFEGKAYYLNNEDVYCWNEEIETTVEDLKFNSKEIDK